MHNTFFELLKRVSNLKWSTNDPEPRTFDDILLSSKIAFQQAMMTVWNEQTYPFQISVDYKNVSAGENTLKAPQGMLLEITLDGKSLALLSDETVLDDKTGKPTSYKFETTNEFDKVTLYPNPDKPYIIGFKYKKMSMAKTKDGTEKFNLEQTDDKINIGHPVYLELFANAVILLTMCNLILDDQDENFVPYKQAYLDALKKLKNYSSIKQEKRIIV